MTKISKKKKSEDVRLHIENSFKFLDEHLPAEYVVRTLDFLKEMGIENITRGTIRNVVQRGPEKCKNLPVLTALVKVAQENQRIVNDFLSQNLSTDNS